jgi:poly [ADP-ribose] polymerase 2/3/4
VLDLSNLSLASHHVYEDDDNLKYDANLNQTNIGENNNKFYIIQLLEHTSFSGPNRFVVWNHWGRVGENGQSKAEHGLQLEVARRSFEKKFRDKTGVKWEDRQLATKSGKYWFIEKDYAPKSDDDDDKVTKKEDKDVEIVSSKLPYQVQDLVQFIFNKNNMNNVMTKLNFCFTTNI